MVTKLFYFTTMVSITLLMASCTNETDDFLKTETKTETVETVTLTVNVPEAIQTRAGLNSDVKISSGSHINKLHFAIYFTGTNNVSYTSEDVEDIHYKNMEAEYDSKSKTFSISLSYVPKSQEFDMVFWACHEDETENNPSKVYTFDCNTKSVTINYDGIKNNDEKRDAFFTSEKGIVLSESNGKTITLRRPFAQLNIGTNDIAMAKEQGIDYSGIAVKVKQVYSQLNLLTGIASSPVDVTFAASEANDSEMNPWPLTEKQETEGQADGQETGGQETENEGYTWISMNYVLTGSALLQDENEKDNVNKAQKETKDVEFTLYGTLNGSEDWKQEYKLSAIPFQRNYRTFITGQFCTSINAVLKILIAPDFYGNHVENQDPQEYH